MKWERFSGRQVITTRILANQTQPEGTKDKNSKAGTSGMPASQAIPHHVKGNHHPGPGEQRTVPPLAGCGVHLPRSLVSKRDAPVAVVQHR